MNIESVLVVINVIACINIVLLTCMLAFRKENVRPNYVLAATLLIPGLYFIDNVLIIYQAPFLGYFFFTVQILANLFPILLYYYIQLLQGGKRKYKPYLLIGTVVTTLVSFGMMIYFLILSDAEKSSFLFGLKSGENYPMLVNIYNVVFYFWLFIYLLVLNKEIKKTEQNVLNHLSNTTDIKVFFAKQLVNLVLALTFILVVSYILFDVTFVDYGVLPLSVTIIYFFIVYFLIKNNAILNKESYLKLKLRSEEINKKEESNNAQENSLLEVKNKIIDALEKKLLYRNSELSLSILANEIEEQSYIISKTLKEEFNKNFYDMINDYRIEEAIILLDNYNPQIDKIDNICYQVGFKSRATFYRAFKKNTGKTPTDYVSIN